jgi:hypothetical protein
MRTNRESGRLSQDEFWLLNGTAHCHFASVRWALLLRRGGLGRSFISADALNERKIEPYKACLRPTERGDPDPSPRSPGRLWLEKPRLRGGVFLWFDTGTMALVAAALRVSLDLLGE